MRQVDVGKVRFGQDLPLVLISGPCQLETLDHARMLAAHLAEVCDRLGMGFVFKASFDKANRSSLAGKRGVGIDEGLSILSKVGAEFGCPVLTDVHDIPQCALAAEAVDILQIPAFMCRQTDLLLGPIHFNFAWFKTQFFSFTFWIFCGYRFKSTEHRI